MSLEWNAYHFVGTKLRDGRPVPPDGETLVHDGPIELCVIGLHASRTAWQALQNAPGCVLCRVHCGGRIMEYQANDKLVCTERTITARIDATDLLQKYARLCASDVLHLWDAPKVVREYLKTGDESLRNAASAAARNAVQGAASDAAWDAAWAAARAAAWAAARAAAGAAALDAALDAAWAAARAAAWAVARAKQRARFDRMVSAAFEGAGK